MNKVAVFLSSYNGEKYILQLLKSLENQTYKNFDLIVRDDGSNDQTVNIVLEFKRTAKINVIILESNGGHKIPELSLSSSFFKLTNYANKDLAYKYFMFCDQDDIWHNNKIQRMVEAILLEEAKSPTEAILVHSDLTLIDPKGKFIHHSFWDWQKINPWRNKTSQLLLQNTVTGCATIMNRKLSENLIEGPHLYYHDHRLALVASLIGRLVPLNEQLIDYRQHSLNVSGAGGKAQNFTTRTIDALSLLVPNKIDFLNQDKKEVVSSSVRLEKLESIVTFGILEAKYLLDLYENMISVETKRMLLELSELGKKSLIIRIWILLSRKFLPNNLYRSAGLLIAAVLMKNKGYHNIENN
jgi:glycosyltransferase involved in cell wall biosynthesis